MTLAEAVIDLQSRVSIDLDVGFDIKDPGQVTNALMIAAREVSRDTYFLFTFHSSVTLTTCTASTDAGAEIDLLSTAVSQKQIFHCYGLHLNGGWVDWMQFDEFLRSYPQYYNDSVGPTPAIGIPITPTSVRLYPAPNSAAAAATDNFAIGFYLHEAYRYTADKDRELSGPLEFHDLISIRAYLNVTESLVSGEDALTRRKIAEDKYEKKSMNFKTINLSRARKLKRRPGAGKTFSTFPLGGSGL